MSHAPLATARATPDAVSTSTAVEAAPEPTATAPARPASDPPLQWTDPNTLLMSSRYQMWQQHSVHLVVSGSMVTRLGMDQMDGRGQLNTKNKNERSRFTSKGASMTLLTSGGHSYLKGDRAFWTRDGLSGPGVHKLLSGYARVKDGSSSLTGMVPGIVSDTDTYFGNGLAEYELFDVRSGTRNGRPVVIVFVKQGAKPKGKLMSATIDPTSGLPLVVECTDHTVTFDEWGQVKKFGKPENILDMPPLDLGRSTRTRT
ncbi:hypothetical protein PZ938_14055 [Luteipulveratus sp. YIM 133132]|uniref:hypothetical protein n=1 Tax=Luteipulveratus flavus TaxID=3031728 RepID=UPI0023AE8531|nr:hypothetical protein [Luteipulveratus sp. YIM 133132]MDE9366733.1 hypothetical protein [Luteipulveratus sp. YIM 133132]